MKILVTGATGFIGSHLVGLLLSKGHQVRCLVRKSSNLVWLKDLSVEYVYGDMFDDAALRQAVAGVHYVYHSAGLTKAKTQEEYYQANSEGTRRLLQATAEVAPGLQRFLHVSSQAAAGPSPTRMPIDEAVDPHPITTYGRSKFQSELECRAFDGKVKYTICRPPVVYGPRDKDVFEFFHTMSRGLQPMVGMQDTYVSLIHVRDLVRGLVMAAESERSIGQTYFISSTGVYSWKELGNITREALGKSALRLRIPVFGIYTVSAVAEVLARFSTKPALLNLEKARDMVQRYWTCDAAKAKKDFGFEQEISLPDGVIDTVRWYRANGWLK
ncbi:MAG: NAD-dependent epimerase/dehydratase family protein [Bacteroidota bacterium]